MLAKTALLAARVLPRFARDDVRDAARSELEQHGVQPTGGLSAQRRQLAAAEGPDPQHRRVVIGTDLVADRDRSVATATERASSGSFLSDVPPTGGGPGSQAWAGHRRPARRPPPVAGPALVQLDIDDMTAMQPVPREHAAVLGRVRRRGPLHELDHVSPGG
jgi:hypothetical protein